MNEAFFYLSKTIWTIISPDSLFVLLLSIGFLLILLNKQKTANFLTGILTAGILFLSFFPVGDWLLFPLESAYVHNPHLPEKVDGILVLGGSVIPDRSVEWQQLETNQSHERLSSFIQLAKQYPTAKLVFTGGNASTDRNKSTEAQIAETYFLNTGISADRLFIDNQARNTAENASYSKQLINPDPDETWILITTAYHMPRAIGVFCQQNWTMLPYPVDHKTLPSQLYQPNFGLIGHASHLVLAAHEWAGLLAYFISAKTSQLFPLGCSYSN